MTIESNEMNIETKCLTDSQSSEAREIMQTDSFSGRYNRAFGSLLRL